MLTKRKIIMGVAFLCIFIIVSFTNIEAGTKVSEKKFEMGLKMITEKGYVLIGYYKPEGSDKEMAEKITNYKAMVELTKKEMTTRFVLYNLKTEKKINVTKILGADISSKSLGEKLWKKICTALNSYKNCADFFGWQ